MIARGQKLPKLGEIETKMEQLRHLLEQKEPQLTNEEVEELVLFLINQNYL